MKEANSSKGGIQKARSGSAVQKAGSGSAVQKAGSGLVVNLGLCQSWIELREYFISERWIEPILHQSTIMDLAI